MSFINRFLPSSKIKNDIQINYNKYANIKPISISEMSLIKPIEKRILNLRDKNKDMNIQKENKNLSLIIPYRHRKENLNEFLPYIIKYLKKQDINYEIIIVEQLDENYFNKAKLMNIGVLNSSSQSDYFIFHDVDLLPENIDYRYSNHTQKLFNFIKEDNKKEYKEYGQTIFGGAISVPKEIFFDINGFSNNYWQWGKEDDDFLMRHLLKGYIPLFDTIGKLISLPHKASIEKDNQGNHTSNQKIIKENKKRYKKNKEYFSKLKRGIINQDNEGISSIDNYKISYIKEENNIKRVGVIF